MNRDNTNRDDKGRYYNIKTIFDVNQSNWSTCDRFLYTPIIKTTYNLFINI